MHHASARAQPTAAPLSKRQLPTAAVPTAGTMHRTSRHATRGLPAPVQRSEHLIHRGHLQTRREAPHGSASSLHCADGACRDPAASARETRPRLCALCSHRSQQAGHVTLHRFPATLNPCTDPATTRRRRESSFRDALRNANLLNSKPRDRRPEIHRFVTVAIRNLGRRPPRNLLASLMGTQRTPKNASRVSYNFRHTVIHA